MIQEILIEPHDIMKTAEKKGAEASEVFILTSEGRSAGIKKDKLQDIKGGMSFGWALRVIKDRKTGFAYSSNPDNLEEIIDSAIKNTKYGEESGMIFSDKEHIPAIKDIYYSDIKSITPEELADTASQIINSVKAFNKEITVTGGGCFTGIKNRRIVNSLGVDVEKTESFYGISVSCVLEKAVVSTGHESMTERNVFSHEEVCNNAAMMASYGQKHLDMPSGKEIGMSPDAFSSLVEFILLPAFKSKDYNRNECMYSGQLEKQILPESIKITEMQNIDGSINAFPFDDEGRPSMNTVLVENGILKNLLSSISDEKKYGTRTTSSSIRSGKFDGYTNIKAPPSIYMRNLHFDSKNRSNVIENIDDGIYIMDALGGHTSNTATGGFSVNSTVIYVVKNGEILGTTSTSMLSGRLDEAMKCIVMTGNDLRPMKGGLTASGMTLPSVLFDGGINISN